MSECTHNCDTCGESCASKNAEIKKISVGKGCKIKHIIGVSSGKGGVGKSFVAALIASGLRKKGFEVGILDADILGPSIPKSFGIIEKDIVANVDNLMIPKTTRLGIKVMSTNLLLENDTDPVIFRGSLIAGTLTQFYQETFWGELDYLIIDMPPGTGDVPLTIYQQIPIDGVIIVSSPQNLVSMIVNKSIKMADSMAIPVIGIIENMSYVVCDSCNNKLEIFGHSNIDEVAEKYNIDVLAKLPIRIDYVKMIDEGMVEDIDIKELDNAINKIIKYKK